MLSTVLSIGGIVALIGGVAYFTFQYMPYVIDFWNQVQTVYFSELSGVLPEWVVPFVSVGLLFAGVGLIVKLL